MSSDKNEANPRPPHPLSPEAEAFRNNLVDKLLGPGDHLVFTPKQKPAPKRRRLSFMKQRKKLLAQKLRARRRRSA